MGRNISTGEGARFMGIIIKLLVVVAIVGAAYYIINKTDLINNIKEKSEKTVEEITECSFKKIDHINTEDNKDIPIEEFENKYKDKKYKAETDMKKLSEDGDVTYYIYSKDDTYEYKLFDLGNGYIKIVKDSATLYKEVE